MIDPLGQTRYDLYRATTAGVYGETLTLGLNDPAGDWSVQVNDLLANTNDTAHFHIDAVSNAGAAAGVAHRAIFFGNDRKNIFRFFREHQDITIVTGTSDYDTAQAQRLNDIVKPWGVRATIVAAADVNKPRHIGDEEAGTWAPNLVQNAEQLAKPGDANYVGQVGFAINGAAVLIGNADDNAIIKFVQAMKFLPYQPKKDDFPGRGHGMVAWQVAAIGREQETLSLIAYDADGMAEAVGSTYEALAGMDPLTATDPSGQATLTQVTTATAPGEAPIAWWISLPDRATTLVANNDQVVAITLDGTATTLDATGKILKQRAAAVESDFIAVPAPADGVAPARVAAPVAVVPAGLAKSVWINHRVKRANQTINGMTAIAYWGGGLQVFDGMGALKSQQTLPNDITDVAWVGNTLVVGLADGRVMGFKN